MRVCMSQQSKSYQSRTVVAVVCTVITKTSNDHKHAQTTTNHQETNTNHQQTTANHQQMTANHQQATTIHQQTTANYQKKATKHQQSTINSHTCKSNQKADVSFLLPAPGSYKDHLDFEKHMQSVRGNCLKQLLS